MASTSDVVGLYLAYFGRPPDPDGLNFYTSNPSVDIWSVAASFSSSAESQALYGSFGVGQINAIYQNLFNRDADPEGLQYWYDVVTSGKLSPAGAAYAILLGAQNDDKVAIANKIKVCTDFTGLLDTPQEIGGYGGATAAARARAYIHTVDSTSDSVSFAEAVLASQVGFATGLISLPFTVTKSASNVVSFANAGAAITVSASNGVLTFSTSGTNVGTATVSGAIAGIDVPTGTTLTISSTLAGGKTFTGPGTTLIVASATGEDLSTLAATGVDVIQLTSGQDYTLTTAQAALAKIGASGTLGHLNDSGKISVAGPLATIGSSTAALKAMGVDAVVGTVSASSDISGASTAGLDGISLLTAANYAMTSAQAALLTTSPGAQVVTLTTAATKLALSGAIERFKLANGVANSVIMGAIDQVVVGLDGDDDLTPISGVKSSIDLGGGANIIRVAAGADISKGTFSATGGTLKYNVDAATTAKMTIAQTAAIDSAAGTQNITLADAATALALNADIETYTLGDFVNSVTIATKTQAVIGGSKADTVIAIDGLTSTLDLKAGANVVIVQDGWNISGATFLATEGTVGLHLDGASTATLSGAQAGLVTSASGTQTVTLGTAATGVTLADVIETFKLGNFTNAVQLGTATQNVTGNTGADTVDVADLAASGTLDGGGGTADKLSVGGTMGAAAVSHFEVLNVTDDSDVTAVNGGAALGTTALTMAVGANLKMTLAQNEAMKASATVANAGQSVTLTTAGTTTAIAGVETYVLAAGTNEIKPTTSGQIIDATALAAGNVLTLTAASVAATVKLTAGSLSAATYTGNLTVVATTGDNTIVTGSGNDVVTAGAGANTVTLGAGADTLVFNSLTGAETVTDFNVSADKIQLSLDAYPTLDSTGSLTSNMFEAAAAATHATTRIVYDVSTGNLFYDADGSGSTAAVLIGTLSNKPVLTTTLFTIVN
jgi:hypothetical protein